MIYVKFSHSKNTKLTEVQLIKICHMCVTVEISRFNPTHPRVLNMKARCSTSAWIRVDSCGLVWLYECKIFNQHLVA